MLKKAFLHVMTLFLLMFAVGTFGGLVTLYYVNRDMMKTDAVNSPYFGKVFTVYKTTNNLTGEYYYGKHGFYEIDDGYLGSGVILKQAIKKHGRKNFSCEHLKFFNTEEAAFEFEKTLITDVVLADPKCYNLGYGGLGASWTEETRQKLSRSKLGSPGTTNGKRFHNNGATERLFFHGDAPEGWVPGRLPSSRRGLWNVKYHK